MSALGARFEVAITRAGHLDVAIPAARISAVLRDHEDDEGLPRLNLAACLGVAAPGAAPSRTHLKIFDAAGPFELSVDGQVSVRDVELTCLHRLPALVRGVGARVGISGLLELEGGLVYFLDLDALNRWIDRKPEAAGEPDENNESREGQEEKT